MEIRELHAREIAGFSKYVPRFVSAPVTIQVATKNVVGAEFSPTNEEVWQQIPQDILPQVGGFTVGSLNKNCELASTAPGDTLVGDVQLHMKA